MHVAARAPSSLPPPLCARRQGFNRVVRPLLLREDTSPFVAFDFGFSRMTVTLPPVPGYHPSADEVVSVVSCAWVQ